MKLIIAGTRRLGGMATVTDAVNASGWAEEITHVLSGQAPGPDYHGERWALLSGIAVLRFHAKWHSRDGEYDPAAGMIRNGEMAKAGDRLLAIWDGRSKGTANMIERMRKLNKPVFIYNPEDEEL